MGSDFMHGASGLPDQAFSVGAGTAPPDPE